MAARDLVNETELSHLQGVTVYDEEALAQSILESTRTQKECGIYTAAPLAIVEELLERVKGEVATAVASGNWESKDHARLRLQLLERLAKSRRSRSKLGGGGPSALDPKAALLSDILNEGGGRGSGSGSGAAAPPPSSSSSSAAAAAAGGGFSGYVVPRGMRVTFETAGEKNTGGAPSKQSSASLKRPPIAFDDDLSTEEEEEEEGKRGGGEGGKPSASTASSSRRSPPLDMDQDTEVEEEEDGEGEEEGGGGGGGGGSGGSKRGRDAASTKAPRRPPSRPPAQRKPAASSSRGDAYEDRQVKFTLAKRTLCKRLRSAAKERAQAEHEAGGLGGKLSSKELRAAADREAPKASIQSPLGPGEQVVLAGGVRVPFFITSQLLPYQRDGLKWLVGLCARECGGILGDEMGLGKTVQVAALLGTLAANGMLRPSIVVCPATLISHWERELIEWWPPLRVAIIHSTAGVDGGGGWGQGWGGGGVDAMLSSAGRGSGASSSSSSSHKHPVPDVFILTYDGLKAHVPALTGVAARWGVVILDEGHKIRNPEAAISMLVKNIPSPRRFILSGSPIQNRLKELWSLMEFAVPGRLGPLPVFEAQFANPIAAGGWAHSTPLQLQAAFHCSQTLKELIEPYLLRRLKKYVNSQLPKKTEQLIMCTMAPLQRAAYNAYVRSSEVGRIMEGRVSSFRGLTILRKITNHPWLLEGGGGGGGEGEECWDCGIEAVKRGSRGGGYRDPLEHSGKLRALANTLEIWSREKRRCLIFTQGTAMLDIIQGYVESKGYRYLRMDGHTSIGSRQGLVDNFNEDPSNFLFLLTTRVGGVGVNLIGADRVVIFDPDWNPATDSQARERAWRLGQRRHVLIYRFFTKGTLEMHIYKQQVFKNATTARILLDPRGSKDRPEFHRLRDLFALCGDSDGEEGGGGGGAGVVFLCPPPP